jgi:hypothetical protein
MSQIDQIRALKADPQKQKQLNEMLKIIDEAFKNNMGAYIKLVQNDVMKEFNAKCDADGVGEERDEFSKGVLDQIMQQVNEDLNAKIMSQFSLLKDSLED